MHRLAIFSYGVHLYNMCCFSTGDICSPHSGIINIEPFISCARVTPFCTSFNNPQTALMILSFFCPTGHFSLDPNRVMDVMLEAVECHSPEKQLLLLPVMRSCNGSAGTLCQLLGFKFQQYAVSYVPPTF